MLFQFLDNRNTMFIRHEFLELFDQERAIDKEAGITEYTISSQNFIFSLYVSAYEGTVIVTLTHKKLNHSVFDLTLKNVSSIKIDKEKAGTVKLILLKKNETMPFVTIMIKPEISLQASF